MKDKFVIAVVKLLFDRLVGYVPSEQIIKNAIEDVRRGTQ